MVVLAGALRRRGHDVTVVSFYRRGALEWDLREADVPVIHLEKSARWDVAPFLARLSRAVSSVRPDAVLGYLVAPNLVSACLKVLRPWTTVIWSVRASDMDLKEYGWIDRFSFNLSCALSRLPNRIVVNSEAGRAHCEAHGYPVDRMVVIPNGVDTEMFRPDPEAGRGLRTDWKIGDKEKVVGLPARLDPMKDHGTFLRAARIAADARSDLRFVCVGGGPEAYRRELERQAGDAGLEERCVWAGARDDMPAVYNAFDVATSTSAFGEGFSNVVAEAMACGTPCAVTDVGDSSRIVGDLGAVVPPRDPVALAAAWLSLLERDGRPDPEVIHQRIVRLFSVDLLADRTESLLREVGAGEPE